MRSRICKFPRARLVALAVGVGAIGSLATAPASFALSPQPPANGTNCQPDGKISGAGSSFAKNAFNNSFTYGFQQDVCGGQPNVSGLNATWAGTDPSVYSFTDSAGTHSVSGMVAYNYVLGTTAATNGSGAGLNRNSCRTDFYEGTDLPYNTTQFASLKAAPGTLPGVAACSNGTTPLNTTAVPPPFGPQPSAGPWPATGDTASTPINFPVAGGAVAMATNLNGMCTVATPTGLSFTADELNKIWMGTINQWNDPELLLTDPILGPTQDNCSGNIQRVVRLDNSGTTAITMFTLDGITGHSGTLCGTDAAKTWIGIGTASNNSGSWPQANGTSPDCVDTMTPSHAAPNPMTATTNGSPPLITLLDTTNGGIGYAELGLWGTLPAGVSFASLQTHDDFVTAGNGLGNPNPGPDAAGNPAFVSAGNPGAPSNCKLPASPPTGTTSTLAVGLGSPNWANDPSGPLKPDVAFTGFGYPACGLTFALVNSKLHSGQTGEVAAPAGGPFTPGCQITAPTPTTTSGDQTLPVATLTVASTAGFPPSGTLSVGGQAVTYTGKTATTFTGAAGGSGLVTSGSAVSLTSTTAGATSTSVGVNGACETVGGVTSPMVGATNDQLRTMYAYFTYALSPLGQSYLGTQTYDQLPAGWLPLEQQGFQQNF